MSNKSFHSFSFRLILFTSFREFKGQHEIVHIAQGASYHIFSFQLNFWPFWGQRNHVSPYLFVLGQHSCALQIPVDHLTTSMWITVFNPFHPLSQSLSLISCLHSTTDNAECRSAYLNLLSKSVPLVFMTKVGYCFGGSCQLLCLCLTSLFFCLITALQ